MPQGLGAAASSGVVCEAPPALSSASDLRLLGSVSSTQSQPEHRPHGAGSPQLLTGRARRRPCDPLGRSPHYAAGRSTGQAC